MTRQEILTGMRPYLPAGPLDWWRIGAAALALLVGPILDPAWAQQRGNPAIMDRMNANTITVVTGDPSLAYFTLAYDLAAVLNDGDELRVLPVASQGAFQNVRDVRYLHGVDLGFAQTNILNYYRRTGEIGNVADKLVYIAKICNEEIHVIVRSEITSLQQLRGRKVNFTTDDSGTRLSAHEIFERLGIPIEEVNFRQNDGLEKLKNGEIAATVLTSGKPAGVLSAIKATDGYRILPIPWHKSIPPDYLPTTLTHEDYPNLIARGETIDTIATGTVLFAYNWAKDSARYRRIDKFVKAFFSKLASFKTPPRHPKWRDTNLAASIPGWKRFEGAERWLASAREQRRHAGRGHPLSPTKHDQLFEGFLRWQQDQGVSQRAGSNQ
jgi:TRAP transporter TAXI family solute receptor